MTTYYYLAGLLSRKDELARYADDLIRAGHEVTARWLWRDGDNVTAQGADPLDYTSDKAARMTEEDIADVKQCDCLILFTENRGIPQPGGCRFIEYGIALGLGRVVAIVGPVENLFLGHPSVIRYDDWTDFVEAELSDTTDDQRGALVWPDKGAGVD